jgi:hypothetical protein
LTSPWHQEHLLLHQKLKVMTFTRTSSSSPKVKGDDIHTPHVKPTQILHVFFSLQLVAQWRSACNCYLDTKWCGVWTFLKGKICLLIMLQ